jgi:S-adenosylmethionine hydrolase
MARSKVRPVITLTTDFGLSDHYAGTMKCVIAGICSNAEIIDITHEIAPADLVSGAYTISQAAAFSPPGTIHVIVVDPGVGTARKAIAVRNSGQTFIAPDNGVLSLVVPKSPVAARELTNPSLFLPEISNTFHGRDIFAPSAAHLASGDIAWESVGPELRDITTIPELEATRESATRWKGLVLSVDRFGNVITNFRQSLFPVETNRFTLLIKSHQIDHFYSTFGHAKGSEIFTYVGSSGYLETAINRGSAASVLGVKPGDSLTLEIHA